MRKWREIARKGLHFCGGAGKLKTGVQIPKISKMEEKDMIKKIAAALLAASVLAMVPVMAGTATLPGGYGN